MHFHGLGFIFQVVEEQPSCIRIGARRILLSRGSWTHHRISMSIGGGGERLEVIGALGRGPNVLAALELQCALLEAQPFEPALLLLALQLEFLLEL